MTAFRPSDCNLEVLESNSSSQKDQTEVDKGVLTYDGYQIGSEGKSTRPLTKDGKPSWNDQFQFLSSRTHKNIKIMIVVGVTSLFAFLVILFVSGLSKTAKHKGETIILQHEIENQYKIRFNSDARKNTPPGGAVRYEGDLMDIRKDPKIFKDMTGKAKEIDDSQPLIGEKISLVPGEELDMVWPEPTEEDVEETLKLVQLRLNNDRKSISNKEIRLWDPSSEPIRVILVGTWESGSNFLQKLIQSHPGVFLHHEPLSYLGLKQIRSGKEAFQAQQIIHRLLDCQYDNVNNYLNYTKRNILATVGQNRPVWESCNIGPNPMTCAVGAFLSDSCQMFPIQFLTTSRLRLNVTQLLLNDKSLIVKVIHLVRDPRAILSSRYKNIDNCMSSVDCKSPEIVCQDMESDLKVTKAFEKLYPKRFLKVKYENLVQNTEKEVLNIFSFLGLDFTEDLKNKMLQIAPKHRATDFKLTGGNAPWKSIFAPEQVLYIERSCESVIKKLIH